MADLEAKLYVLIMIPLGVGMLIGGWNAYTGGFFLYAVAAFLVGLVCLGIASWWFQQYTGVI